MFLIMLKKWWLLTTSKFPTKPSRETRGLEIPILKYPASLAMATWTFTLWFRKKKGIRLSCEI